MRLSLNGALLEILEVLQTSREHCQYSVDESSVNLASCSRSYGCLPLTALEFVSLGGVVAVSSAQLSASPASGQPDDLLLPQDIVWRVARQPRTGHLVLAANASAAATSQTANGELLSF